MFSTFLDKVTGYFDKRAIVSAFFPSLIFWGMVVAAFIVLQMNWQSALAMWDKLSLTAQFLLFLAYFVWVTFWSFLTINFRQAYVRLFEGYWPDTWLFRPLLHLRQGYWQKRWQELDDKDKKLVQQESTLESEQDDYEKLEVSLTAPTVVPADKHSLTQQLLSWLLKPLNVMKQRLTNLLTHIGQTGKAAQITAPQPPPDTNNVGQELDTFLAQHIPVESPPPPIPNSLADLQLLGQEVRNWWQQARPWFVESQQNRNSPWVHRFASLEQITQKLIDEVGHQLKEIQIQRQSLYRTLSLYYPPQGYIMPTQLGNVLKAAELYSWERYQVDSVVIWSRLQSDIPDAFSAPLQDAKTSLDLVITLAAFLLLFGIPLATWTAWSTVVFLPWWIPLILAFIAFLLRLYIPLGFILILLLLSLLSPILQQNLLLLSGHLQVLLLGLIIVSFLFWLSYANAVQAAIGYGEKIKAAIDLYRWSVLKDLHLETPKDLDEERKMWQEVNSFWTEPI